jgi:hypothetical protein
MLGAHARRGEAITIWLLQARAQSLPKLRPSKSVEHPCRLYLQICHSMPLPLLPQRQKIAFPPLQLLRVSTFVNSGAIFSTSSLGLCMQVGQVVPVPVSLESARASENIVLPSRAL